MEDFFVTMLKSLGMIFGPLMLFAGLAAVVACVRATMRPERVAARRSLMWSLAPPALGVAGSLFGLAWWGLSGPVPASPNWTALGYTILFGVLVAVVPVVWSLVLLNRRPAAFA